MIECGVVGVLVERGGFMGRGGEMNFYFFVVNVVEE